MGLLNLIKSNHFFYKQPYRINRQHHIAHTHYQCAESGRKKTKSCNGDGHYIVKESPEQVLFNGKISVFTKAKGGRQVFKPWFINTTCALCIASCEASLSDTPIVAFASAGASLMPSPIITVGASVFSSAIFCNFCSGLVRPILF